ncbi:MAG: hypothetical protein DWQ07_18700 [Chloroflexi bacterium]|nr:MAG: hypothetical protein DWQ07_18700 [Chloroflexota bacterium]MBL1194962.1 hypothetical protein [Chloroflexota bacterium]NOH12252.1 hypothetical protein [Chloroflexota bacterium]
MRGWLLDIYIDMEKGVKLWLIGEDGERYCLRHDFPITFYARGQKDTLNELFRYLKRSGLPVVSMATRRRELFDGEVPLLAVQMLNAAHFPMLRYELERRFPNLHLYDFDVHIAGRYTAAYDVFPLAYVDVGIDKQDNIDQIQPLETPETLHPRQVPLRTLTLVPDRNPIYEIPRRLQVGINGEQQKQIYVRENATFVRRVQELIEIHDPDLILTHHGDSWLFPFLAELAKRYDINFNPNRDQNRPPETRKATSFFVYGKQEFLEQRTLLYGRAHIDLLNGAAAAQGYHLHGAIELARVTGMPLQEIARRSPGSGVTFAQAVMAMRSRILVPYKKQRAEAYRSPRELLRADRAGFQSTALIGLHENVSEWDCDALFPSVITQHNLSPETISDKPSKDCIQAPGTNIYVDQSKPGLIPATIRPIIQKRRNLKAELRKLGKRDYRYPITKDRIDALKWLLVITGGHLGFPEGLFTVQTAYEAMTAFARKKLKTGKHIAEKMGYRVLFANIDNWIVQKDGATRSVDFQPLFDEIERRTGMLIDMEHIFKWVAFAPSRQDPEAPVANMWFGADWNGETKVRGLHLRRGDTPPFIAAMQQSLIDQLGMVATSREMEKFLPELFVNIRKQWLQLRLRQVPIEDLTMTQKLRKPIEAYKLPSPAARAAMQLATIGKIVHPGQAVSFVHTTTPKRVHASFLPYPIDSGSLDIDKYAKLFLRAAHIVLEPLGVDEATLKNWLLANADYGTAPGRVKRSQAGGIDLPLWNYARARTESLRLDFLDKIDWVLDESNTNTN